MSNINLLVEYIEDNAGYSYDIEIPEHLFEECEHLLEETSKTIVTKYFPEAYSYRDDRKRKSVHITDYRSVERDDLKSDVIVGHLERFNPEHHPILHAVVDFLNWNYKNRIREKNNL